MPTSDIVTVYTPSIYGRTVFPLRHKGDPIFYKIFNSEDSNIVDIENDTIYIQNHFFKTGEPLKYKYNSSGSSIGISSSSPGAEGILTTFPEIVYPIVVTKDIIRISLSPSYAENNQYVDISSLGIGTEHSLECFKQNTKCLISINNIIQSPVSVGSTVKVTSYSAISLTLESLENIKIGTCLKINDEIVRVSSINYDENVVSISRGINVLGTELKPFTNSLLNSYIEILSGNYNIVEDLIYFDEPPLESNKIVYKIKPSDIVYSDYSFNILSDILSTGTQVLMSWSNPPEGIPKQQTYYIIKNKPNNFSLAKSFSDSISGIKLTFPDISENLLPISGLQLIYYYPSENNSFNGRVFLKSNYDSNLIFDDISEQFNGKTGLFELKSSGISTSGISSDNGIVLINNIFQYPGSNQSFSYVENDNKTFVNFVGFGSTGFLGKDYDVNVKGYPRGGIIISYGTTSGLNYTPLSSYSNVSLVGSSSGIGASVSFETDQYGNIMNFKFTNRGYNYKVGEILKPDNVLGNESQTDDDKLHITIDEVAKDTFNAWNLGILDKFDDLSSKVDGRRKSFSLTKNGNRISLDADSEYEIDLQYNLLVFINDILQIPNSSYIFKNGSVIRFLEAIPLGSDVKVYFYKGYINDTFEDSFIPKIKIGDSLQLSKDIYNPPPSEQNKRVVEEIQSSDVLKTNLYSDVGLSEDSSQFRSVVWTPQKSDLILDGSFISKSREQLNSDVILFEKIGSYIGIFSGISTNLIGIDTTNLLIGDYIESNYVSLGMTVTSVGSGVISIGSTLHSYSPTGINTDSVTIYRKS